MEKTFVGVLKKKGAMGGFFPKFTTEVKAETLDEAMQKVRAIILGQTWLQKLYDQGEDRIECEEKEA